ncbi:putative oxidoreductase yvaA [Fusarium mexicanum]|uniref:Putative oxidoreductase yvaA n=1 Tax=Fusarium mexicanum TaxID=751941 RepID=A0A8H5MKW7_9HYPO|nr:putative oxidoreductase yvaA [Fusarium mexicanum]
MDNASNHHPHVKVYRSADELFADKLVDILVITSTPETHFQFANAALMSHMHVLVEKPFVATSSEAQELIDVSNKTGKLICVYQNRRWDADFLTVRHLIQEGELGRIVEFETHMDGYRPVRLSTWRGSLTMDEGVGIVYDVGTHLFDQVYVLFGMPQSVTAMLSNQRNDGNPVPDSMTVLLDYGKEGPLVTVKAGVMSVETKQLRFWIRGSKGSFRKCHLDVQEDQLKAGLIPGDEGFGVEDEEASGTLTVLDHRKPVSYKHKNVKPETYASLYNEFIQAMESSDKELVPVKASEARDVLRIIEAARESARIGKVITL